MEMRKIIQDKRGGLFDIFVVLVMAFVILVFFAGWMYVFGLFTQEMTNIGMVGTANVSDIALDTFGEVNAQLDQLHWIAAIMIFGMFISILLSNFLVKAHPAFFILYVLVTMVAIVVSAILSNAYMDLLTNDVIGSELSGFTAGSFIMEYLPIWAVVIGLVGGLFLYAGISRDREFGGSPY